MGAYCNVVEIKFISSYHPYFNVKMAFFFVHMEGIFGKGKLR